MKGQRVTLLWNLVCDVRRLPFCYCSTTILLATHPCLDATDTAAIEGITIDSCDEDATDDPEEILRRSELAHGFLYPGRGECL